MREDRGGSGVEWGVGSNTNNSSTQYFSYLAHFPRSGLTGCLRLGPQTRVRLHWLQPCVLLALYVRLSDTDTLCNPRVALSSMPKLVLTHTHTNLAGHLMKGQEGAHCTSRGISTDIKVVFKHTLPQGAHAHIKAAASRPVSTLFSVNDIRL